MSTNNRNWKKGRGRGSYGVGKAVQTTKHEPRDGPMGKILLTLEVDDLEQAENDPESEAKILDCSFITSFNWISRPTGKPTLLIPGEPPKWTPPLKAVRLSEDSGAYFRDQNAARFPKHPMEPTALALLETEPSLTASLDLVVCGSTFGNLLRFSRSDATCFRIIVERVNHTVFFVRKEKSPTEKIEGIYGYGHTFPEAYTSWSVACRGSESHQRLVRYTFGGLRVLMRFEGDGYLPKRSNGIAPSQETQTHGNDHGSTGELISGLTSAMITPRTPAATGSLDILRGGKMVPQNEIFDLKTRSYKKRNVDTLGQELPRLWARQIPNFVLAHHQNGVFHDIEILPVQGNIAQWEEQNSNELSMFAVLLDKITTFVRSLPEGKIELCCDGGRKLEFREQPPDAGSVLSSKTKARWIAAVDDISDSKVDNSGAEGGVSIEWASDEDGDYTACTESCGYCGRCTY